VLRLQLLHAANELLEQLTRFRAGLFFQLLHNGFLVAELGEIARATERPAVADMAA
jgi:hypothetical protein